MCNSTVSYDYNFITEPDDDLKCLICHEVASDPWQHSDCGKLFCEKCLEKYGMRKPCPICRMELPQYFRDNKSKREIRALGVKCDNVERGCQWAGTVGTLEEHVDVCDFTLVPCSNKCKDDNGILMIMRRDLQQHLIETCPNKDYSCEHCGLKGTYATTQDHYHTCEKMIVTCRNEECNMRMERMKIKNHLANDCEHTVISCKYVSIGCDVKLKRKDMRAHEQDDKAHLNKALDTVVKLEDTVVKLEDNVVKLEDTVVKLEDTVVKLEDKMAKSEVKVNLKAAKMEETMTSLKREVVLVKGESMIFKITKYQKKKDNNIIFTSPPYYTSPNGYHMNIIVFANGGGDGKGSHVSVFANIVKGKYDDELNWPFVGEVRIDLLNQLEDKNHYTIVVPITPKDNTIVGSSGRGYHKYIPHSKLSRDSNSNMQYLKDDTLYFRISFQVPDHHKPWLQSTV